MATPPLHPLRAPLRPSLPVEPSLLFHYCALMILSCNLRPVNRILQSHLLPYVFEAAVDKVVTNHALTRVNKKTERG